MQRCSFCSAPIPVGARVCQNCSALRREPKNKQTAVLLAVFLGCWTWLYTYKRDATKFWIGLVTGVIGGLLAFVVVGLFAILGIWIWAIVDAASKPDSWYQQFPVG